MDWPNFSLKQKDRIYLDHNATTPVAQVVMSGLDQWAAEWGNPSSIHQTGRGPKALMRSARKTIAQGLGAHPLEIVFTSGGSEANNLAIKGVAEAVTLKRSPKFSGRTHFMCSEVEHPATIKAFEALKGQGFEVDFIPVDRNGRIDLNFFQAKLSEKTALVSVMFANNETGNIFPIKEMASMAHQVGALFHTDAVQALGKSPFQFEDLDVDFLSLSAHKFYALKGSGILLVKSGTYLERQIHGGGQERHRRAGTENLLAICALAEMVKQLPHQQDRQSEMGRLRDLMESLILADVSGVKVTGAEAPRVGNTSNLIISGVDGESLLMNLDLKGFSVSTGAACSSGNPEPSPVLLAMGLSRQEAQGSLRVSLGWSTTEQEIRKFVEVLKQTVIKLRSFDEEGESQYGV